MAETYDFSYLDTPAPAAPAAPRQAAQSAPIQTKYDFSYLDTPEDKAASLFEASFSKPTEEAKKKTLSATIQRMSGEYVPASVMDVGESERRARQLEADHATRASPRTSAFLSNPENAKIAMDDAKVLAMIETAATGLGRGALSLPGQFASMAGGIADAVLGTPFGLRSELGSMGRDWKRNVDTLLPPSQQKGILPEGWASGFESLGANLPLVLGAVAAGPAAIPAVLGLMSFASGGSSVQNAQEKGAGVYRTAALGVTDAVAEYWTEKIGVKYLMDIPGLKNAFLKTAAKFAGAEMVGEQAATVWQDFNEWMLLNPDKTLKEFGDERLHAAAVTALATVIGGGGQVAVMKGVSHILGSQQAQDNGANLIEMAALVAESETHRIHTPTMDVFLQQVTDGATVFIDPDRLTEALAESKLDLATVLPTAAAAIANREYVGTGIAIPVSELISGLAGTGFEQAVIEHVRKDPDAMTIAEANKPIDDQMALYQEAVEKALKTGERSAAVNAEIQQIQDDVAAGLDAVGAYTPTANKTQSKAIGAFYAVLADKVGVTPLQLRDGWTDAKGVPHKGVRFSIGGVTTAAPTNTLSQGFDHGEAMLNVGLTVGLPTPGAQTIDAAFVKSEIEKFGVTVTSGENVDGEYTDDNGNPVKELTYVPHLSRPLTADEMLQLTEALQQEAIPQYHNGAGGLYGTPENVAKYGGAFNGEYFKDQKGVKLSDSLADKELAQLHGVEDDSYDARRARATANDPKFTRFSYGPPHKALLPSGGAMWLDTSVAGPDGGKYVFIYGATPTATAEEVLAHAVQTAKEVRNSGVFWPDKRTISGVVRDAKGHDLHGAEFFETTLPALSGARRDSAMDPSEAAHRGIAMAVAQERRGQGVSGSVAHTQAGWLLRLRRAIGMKEPANWLTMPIEEKAAALQAAVPAPVGGEAKDAFFTGWSIPVAVAPREPLLYQDGAVAEGAQHPDTAAAFAHVAKNEKQLIDRYLARFGNVVDPDNVKMLFASYAADKSTAHLVHEPSSVLAKKIFTEALRRNAGKPVVFTAGGGGSGKTETLSAATNGETPLVYDSTLSAFSSAKARIDEALASGAPVQIVYANRPVEAAFAFAMQRDRVVPLTVLAKAHIGASDTLRAVAKHYADNPNVAVQIVNNLEHKTEIVRGSIEDVPEYVYADVERSLHGLAEKALADGTISAEKYAALTVPAAGGQNASGRDRSLQQGQRQQDLAGPAERAGAVAGPVTGIHFSKEPRETLLSSMFGTGMKGAERDYVFAAKDKRLRHRIAFYINTGNGIFPESGVGGQAHAVSLTNLYDADADTLKIWRKIPDERDRETAVLDAGFDGFLTRSFGQQGAAVLLGERAVQAEHMGGYARSAWDLPKALIKSAIAAGNAVNTGKHINDLQSGFNAAGPEAQAAALATVLEGFDKPNDAKTVAGFLGGRTGTEALAAILAEQDVRKLVQDRATVVSAPVLAPERLAAQALVQNNKLPARQSGAEWRKTLERDMPEQAAAIDWDEIKPAEMYYRDQLAQTLWQGGQWYYSQLETALTTAPAKVFTSGKAVSQWLTSNAAKLGIKKAEIEATGITDWLDTQGKVTQGQVQEFLAQGGVRLEETVLGEPPEMRIVTDGQGEFNVVDANDIAVNWGLSYQQAQQWISREAATAGSGTKFSGYQLPGGENYREWLLTLPTPDAKDVSAKVAALDARIAGYEATGAELRAQYPIISERPSEIQNRIQMARDLAQELQDQRKEVMASKDSVFRSSHFDQPNIVAHIRTNERVDADGKRVLFIEELQSDWGQKGKKEGFAGPTNPYEERNTLMAQLYAKYGIDQNAVALRKVWSAEEQAQVESLTERIASTPSAIGITHVPSAPFVTDTKSWTALALKRMIAYAAENGFDRVAWTTGEQQAARYDLSKQIDSLRVRRDGTDEYTVIAELKGGPLHEFGQLRGNDLEEHVGKDLAAKIQAQTEDFHTYSGLDLKVGGEGMKGYYDAIVPQVANDVLKKIGGGKVGEVRIESPLEVSEPERTQYGWAVQVNGKPFTIEGSWPRKQAKDQAIAEYRRVNQGVSLSGEQPGFDITDAMREVVATTGMPLFAGTDGPKRGSFNPATMDLRLLADANLSTFLHEASHWFLAAYTQMASEPGAPQALVDEVNALLAHLFTTVQGGAQVLTEGGNQLNQQPRKFVPLDEDVAADLWEDRIPAARDAVLQEFFDRKPGELQAWSVVAAGRLKKIWNDHAATGVVRDEKGLDNIVERIVDNYARLEANTALLGHTSNDPVEMLRDYLGDRYSDEELQQDAEAFAEYAVDANGAYRLSDYGLFRIAPLVEQLVSATTPEQKLTLIDMVLNVVHQRSDLAAMFVEGGTSTLSDLALFQEVGASDTAPGPLPAGATPLEQWNSMSLDQQRPYHEAWAESGEQYFMTGKAPSLALDSVFRTFANWLKRIYGSLKEFVAQHSGVPQAGGDLAQQVGAGETVTRGVDVWSRSFRDWFGASKVIDDRGRPLRVYHGTAAEVMAFDVARSGANYPSTGGQEGLYFTDEPIIAGVYAEQAGYREDGGENTVPVYLSLQNPIERRTGTSSPDKYFDYNRQKILVAAKKAGADGVIVRGGDRTLYVAFKPTQIKSAISNTGAFSRTDPNILHAGSKGSGVKLHPTTAAFFDRMLATEAEIQQANEARGYVQLFKDAAEAGMTENGWAAYQAMGDDQREDAEAMLRARSLRDMKWLQNARTKIIGAMQKEAEVQRKAVREQIAAELAATPLRLAVKWLKKGEMTQADGTELKVTEGHKLQISDIEAIFPEGALTPRPDLSALRGMTAKEGLAPDLVAEMFGFRSGEALVRDLLELKPFKEEVEELTDLRMLQDHSELIDPDAIARAADEAIHNDARTRMVATELSALAKGIGSPASLMEAAKAYAKQLIETKTSKTLKPWSFAAAETRASKAALEALRKGKRDDAAQQKRLELLNHVATKQAYEAEAEVKKTIDRFKKIAGYKDDSSSFKSRDAELVNAVRAILADFGIGTKGKSAREYLAVVAQHNPDLGAILSDTIDAVSENAKDWRDLKISEVRDLAEEIEGLWFLAKRSKQIEIDGKMITLHEAQQAIYDRLDEIGIPDRVPGEGSAVTAAEKRGILFDRFVGALRRVEAWVGAKDGALSGPFRTYMWNPIRDASDAYRADKARYLKAYRDLLTPIAPSLTRRLIDAPEIGYTFGKDEGGMGKIELLHAILHTGNESNKRKLLLGRGWATATENSIDTSKWDAFLQRMHDEGILTKADYEFAQGVWDLLESMKPLAQKAHRDVFGKYFAEVTANEFTNQFGTFAGGYVPAMTDPLIVRDADLNKMREGEEGNMAYAFPTTSKGFTKSRVEYNKPLKLDLRTLSQHIDKVLLFAHMTRPTNDVRRVMSGKAVAQAMGRVDPQAYNTLLLPWLNRAAKQIVETQTPGREGLGRFWSVVRARAGMAAMFANVANSVQQITGLSLAAVRVRPGLLMDAMAKYAMNPTTFAEHVTSKSSYMATRLENEVSLMSSQINEILLNPSIYESAKEWTNKHAYFLQSAVDSVISPVVWLGGYNQAIEAGMSETDAVRAGDSAVRETQGSQAPEDIAAFETGSAFYRMFTQFAGYFNMNANLLGTEFVKVSRDMGLKKGAGRGLYLLTLGFLAPAIVGELIMQLFKGGPGDDDKDGEYLDDWLAAVFGYGVLRYATAMVPGFGPAVNATVNTLNNKPYDDRISTAPAISMIEAAVKAPIDLYKAIVEEGKPSKAIKEVATLISMSVGVPASAVAKSVSYWADVAAGRVVPIDTLDAVRGTITGTASPASKQ